MLPIISKVALRMYKICFLSLTSQSFAWLKIACKLGTLCLKTDSVRLLYLAEPETSALG